MVILNKLNKVTSRQAALIIAVVGFMAFFRGLRNQFLGDDFPQIVNNLPVHSLANIGQFFEGGTFYGGGSTDLYGTYYRPLMSTVYSLLYTLFGSHPFYFHLTQLVIALGTSYLVFLFFRYSLKPLLALLLALIFLVHPIDSEVVYAIPCMQDALYLFFGMLALWILVRYRSKKSITLAAVSLFLALLSKETAILFVLVALLYLFWWNRRRLYFFMALMVLPIAAWVFLRINAIGLNPTAINAPIDTLSLPQRLLNVPAIIELYFSKVLFPWHLSSEYYWTYSGLSIDHFLLPLCFDLIVVTAMIFVGSKIARQATQADYYTYLFFAIWLVIGMILTLQVIPLDMTASESWFYFPMVGLLGMIGVAINTLVAKNKQSFNRALCLLVLLVVVFGARTALRASDWSNALSLDYKNIQYSSDDYVGEENVASVLFDEGKLQAAKPYAEASTKIYTTGDNYYILGLIDSNQREYSQAEAVFYEGLQHHDTPLATQLLYENTARMMVLVSSPSTAKQFIVKALDIYQQDAQLWFFLALIDYKTGDAADAKYTITKAASYSDGQDSTINSAYKIIMSDGSLKLQ